MSSATLATAAPTEDAPSGPAQPLRPFVIWTLQRTGGTNLTRQLVRLSGLPRTEHEPFNEGRAYGHVTAAWRKDRDALAMGAAMQEIAAEHQVIKHCVEMVPPEINGGLALAIAYEDLYQSTPARSQHVLQRLFDELGFRFPPRRLPHIWEQVVGQGDQGTRSAYAAFEGQVALGVALERWRGFRPVPEVAALHTAEPDVPAPWVAAADQHGAGPAVPRRRRLDGTVVCAAGAPAGLRLVLADAQGGPRGGVGPAVGLDGRAAPGAASGRLRALRGAGLLAGRRRHPVGGRPGHGHAPAGAEGHRRRARAGCRRCRSAALEAGWGARGHLVGAGGGAVAGAGARRPRHGAPPARHQAGPRCRVLAGPLARRAPQRRQTRCSNAPCMARSLSIRCGAMSCSGSTSFAAPWAMASRGMPKTTQVASFCA